MMRSNHVMITSLLHGFFFSFLFWVCIPHKCGKLWRSSLHLGLHAHHYTSCGRRRLGCTSARACASVRRRDCLWSSPSGSWPSSSHSSVPSTPPSDLSSSASPSTSSPPSPTPSPSNQPPPERYHHSLLYILNHRSKNTFEKSFLII